MQVTIELNQQSQQTIYDHINIVSMFLATLSIHVIFYFMQNAHVPQICLINVTQPAYSNEPKRITL